MGGVLAAAWGAVGCARSVGGGASGAGGTAGVAAGTAGHLDASASFDTARAGSGGADAGGAGRGVEWASAPGAGSPTPRSRTHVTDRRARATRAKGCGHHDLDGHLGFLAARLRRDLHRSDAARDRAHQHRWERGARALLECVRQRSAPGARRAPRAAHDGRVDRPDDRQGGDLQRADLAHHPGGGVRGERRGGLRRQGALGRRRELLRRHPRRRDLPSVRVPDQLPGGGDVAGDKTLSGGTNGSYYFSVEPRRSEPGAQGAVVTLGASITDGYSSRSDVNRRWPNDLAVRVVKAGRAIGVLNQGISGDGVGERRPALRPRRALAAGREVGDLLGRSDQRPRQLQSSGADGDRPDQDDDRQHARSRRQVPVLDADAVPGRGLLVSAEGDGARGDQRLRPRRRTAAATASSTRTRRPTTRPIPPRICPPTTPATTCTRTRPASRRSRTRSTSRCCASFAATPARRVALQAAQGPASQRRPGAAAQSAGGSVRTSQPVARDEDGVLELRGERAVGGHDRPPVVELTRTSEPPRLIIGSMVNDHARAQAHRPMPRLPKWLTCGGACMRRPMPCPPKLAHHAAALARAPAPRWRRRCRRGARRRGPRRFPRRDSGARSRRRGAPRRSAHRRRTSPTCRRGSLRARS